MELAKKVGFYLASCTWGIIATLIGALITWGLVLIGYRPYKFHNTVVFEIGENWGGFSLGFFAFVNCISSTYLLLHESGHGIQNIMLGPVWPFIVGIPSMVRYWYRGIIVKLGRKKESELPDYYSIWFEKWASDLGEKYYDA